MKTYFGFAIERNGAGYYVAWVNGQKCMADTLFGIKKVIKAAKEKRA